MSGSTIPSALDLGPLYGPVSDIAWPVLGQPHVYDSFSGSHPQHQTETVHYGEESDVTPAILLEHGCGNLSSIELKNGEFQAFGALMQPSLPALWDAQDCQTVTKLIYGQENRIFPQAQFLLNRENPTRVDQCIFGPDWLSDTNFGKTLFCTHYWLLMLACFHEVIPVARENPDNPSLIPMAREFASYLKVFKERYNTFVLDRFVLKPAGFQGSIEQNPDGDGCILHLQDMRMQFEFWRYTNDGNMHLDKEGSQAYGGLFSHYIYAQLPVYTRLTLLYALYSGVSQIKEAGFAPKSY